jgi:hypothetical protein
MSKSLVVRYRTKPECAEENALLIEAVFAELAQTQPDGLSYRAYRLADGVSFVHAVTLSAPENPLSTSPAFAAFQSGIAQGCAEGPTPMDATVLGSFG